MLTENCVCFQVVQIFIGLLCILFSLTAIFSPFLMLHAPFCLAVTVRRLYSPFDHWSVTVRTWSENIIKLFSRLSFSSWSPALCPWLRGNGLQPDWWVFIRHLVTDKMMNLFELKWCAVWKSAERSESLKDHPSWILLRTGHPWSELLMILHWQSQCFCSGTPRPRCSTRHCGPCYSSSVLLTLCRPLSHCSKVVSFITLRKIVLCVCQ